MLLASAGLALVCGPKEPRPGHRTSGSVNGEEQSLALALLVAVLLLQPTMLLVTSATRAPCSAVLTVVHQDSQLPFCRIGFPSVVPQPVLLRGVLSFGEQSPQL